MRAHRPWQLTVTWNMVHILRLHANPDFASATIIKAHSPVTGGLMEDMPQTSILPWHPHLLC